MIPVARLNILGEMDEEQRDQLWEIVAKGSYPFLIVTDGTDFYDDSWFIQPLDRYVSVEKVFEELKILEECILRFISEYASSDFTLEFEIGSHLVRNDDVSE